MAPSTTIRRLLKEVAELSAGTSNPNPAFYAAPVSDSDLHEWHFILLGPPTPSPYAGGLYHGRISLPSQYPLKPPNFRFLTPSGRFEVNREICLSISGFHEETWMPAWGVRTALTALRSFMAEQGTAGQVGGLEATEDVRKRMARESKSWRCSDCGKTNEVMMNDWWAVCREKGVKVDEEGMGLEALPDGMAVEAIDRSKGKGKAEQNTDTTSLIPEDRNATDLQSQVSTTQETTVPSSPELTYLAPKTPLVPESQSRSQPAAASSPLQSTALTTSIPNNPPQPSSPLTEHLSRPAPTPTTPTTPTTSQSTRAPQQQRHQPETQAITLDRAITAVFLALCIMILKKIFFPSSQSGYGGANDDWDIGLSREY